jgi:hypothetical protein
MRQIVAKNGLDAGIEYVEKGGSDKAYREMTRDSPAIHEYTKRGYTLEEARVLAKMERMPADMDGETKYNEAKNHIRLEDDSAHNALDGKEKSALIAKAAQYQQELAKQKSEEAAQQFQQIYQQDKTITNAMEARESATTAEGINNPVVQEAVNKRITQEQIKKLDERFKVDFLSADTMDELKNLERLYNPESKSTVGGNSYKSDYEGQDALQWTHYNKIRDELNDRKKALDKDAGPHTKEELQQLQDNVYAIYAKWQTGGVDGQAVIDTIQGGIFALPPAKAVDILQNVVCGIDGDPRTKEVYGNMEKMFKTLGIDESRRLGIREALYQMRTEGKDPEAIQAQIGIFRKTETAAYLTKAMTSLDANQGVSVGDMEEIIKAGNNGELDNYFVQRSSVEGLFDRGGGQGKQRLTVGGDSMNSVMNAVKNESQTKISEILGQNVVMREALDKDGDFKGYFTADVDGQTVRLANKGHGYILEKQQGGKWVEYEVQGQGKPGISDSNYGSQIEQRNAAPYINNTPAQQAKKDRDEWDEKNGEKAP